MKKRKLIFIAFFIFLFLISLLVVIVPAFSDENNNISTAQGYGGAGEFKIPEIDEPSNGDSTPTPSPTPSSDNGNFKRDLKKRIEVNKQQLISYITIAALILGGLILGLITEKIAALRIIRLLKNKKLEWLNTVFSTLRGFITFLFVMAGLNMTILYVPMNDNMESFVQKAVLVGVILSITILVSRIAVGLVKQYISKMASSLPSASLMENITQLFIYLFGGLILLHTLGISITPILTALGVGGLAVALALQDTLTNLFSGLYIIATKEVEPGDYVKLNSGEEGYVVDITWRNTTIEALQNNIIIIPNSKFASSIVTNFYRPNKQMNLLIQVGVGYESDLQYVEEVTLEVAKEILEDHPGGIGHFEPSVRFHTFADSSINFTVVLRINEFLNQYQVKSAFIKKLHARYKKENINIPFPIRTVIMKK